MTSGNLSEEPIAQNNEEAWNRLRPLADVFLFHNREIYARYDDSVWFAPSVSGEKGETLHAVQPIRRSRGYAPFPLKLPFSSQSAAGLWARIEKYVLFHEGAIRLSRSAHRGHGEPGDAGTF